MVSIENYKCTIESKMHLMDRCDINVNDWLMLLSLCIVCLFICLCISYTCVAMDVDISCRICVRRFGRAQLNSLFGVCTVHTLRRNDMFMSVAFIIKYIYILLLLIITACVGWKWKENEMKTHLEISIMHLFILSSLCLHTHAHLAFWPFSIKHVSFFFFFPFSFVVRMRKR